MKYQLAAFGPAAKRNFAELEAEFDRQLKALGLTLGVDAEIFEVVTTGDVMRIDFSGAPIGIWFGDSRLPFPQHLVDLCDDLLNRAHPVFPVCQSLDDYDQKVPASLVPISAQPWNEPTEKTVAVANVLAGFRLVQRERSAFISYFRRESSLAARQIFERLVARNFHTFLDTISIAHGVSFEEVLKGRLADIDLIVFLDTPTAVSSKWVYDELNQADVQGTGVLQVLWPGRLPHPGCGAAKAISLTYSDHFVNQQANANDTLTDDALALIAQEAEGVRIRSIRNRRERLLGQLKGQTQSQNLTPVLQRPAPNGLPAGSIELRRNGALQGTVLTTSGLPTSQLIEERSRTALGIDPSLARVRLVYDELGVHPDRARHLRWLRDTLKEANAIAPQPITALTDWLGGL